MKHVGMGRRKVVHTSLGLLLMGCGVSGSGGEGPTAQDGGAVCLACQVAGGESSDFGAYAQPTPCVESEVREALTEAEARDLGFGESLDLFQRSVTQSWAWTVMDTSGPTATGYDPSSSVTLTSSVAGVEHLVPSLAGCTDRVLVHVAVQLSTADGALAIAGELTSVVERQPRAFAFGLLDLTTGSGSLRVAPPAWEGGSVGYFALGVYYWPEATRGFSYVQLVQKGTDPRSDEHRGYRPLEGRFPVDTCDASVLPVAPGTSLQEFGGRSANDIRDEVAALLDAKHPAAANWSSGQQTSVTATLGMPSEVCRKDSLISYSVPLTVTSADGRVDISGVARANAGANAAGGLTEASFEIYDYEVLTAQEFAAKSGISGVSFADVPRALWYVEVSPLTAEARGPRGQVAVEGVMANGAAVEPLLEELTWSLE